VFEPLSPLPRTFFPVGSYFMRAFILWRAAVRNSSDSTGAAMRVKRAV
jgi:hypothetical protein